MWVHFIVCAVFLCHIPPAPPSSAVPILHVCALRVQEYIQKVNTCANELTYFCFPLCVYSCAHTVCVTYTELTGHQSRCGKWKWCSGGETPGGRLGINSRGCDALWSPHLRGRRGEKSKWRRDNAEQEGGVSTLKEQNLLPTRQQVNFQMQEELNSEDLQLAARRLFQYRTHLRTCIGAHFKNLERAESLTCRAQLQTVFKVVFW